MRLRADALPEHLEVQPADNRVRYQAQGAAHIAPAPRPSIEFGGWRREAVVDPGEQAAAGGQSKRGDLAVFIFRREMDRIELGMRMRLHEAHRFAQEVADGVGRCHVHDSRDVELWKRLDDLVADNGPHAVTIQDDIEIDARLILKFDQAVQENR